MNRTEALKVLRLDGDSDGRAIEQSYWGLVRRAQSRADEVRGRADIERLNEAYALLSPTGEPQNVTAKRVRPAAAAVPVRSPAAPGFSFLDEVIAWVGNEGRRIQARWSERNLEIALIGGAALVLIVAALLAGASIALVLVCAALVVSAIWAPWRRPADNDEEPPAKR